MNAGGGSSGTSRVIVHCYASAADVRRPTKQRALGEFCREMGRATKQVEVGLVIDNVYHAIHV